jgi:primary-amine oxidase
MTVETRVEHPLDPLTPREIEAAAGIVRADPRAGGTPRFVSIDLREPPKPDVVAGRRETRSIGAPPWSPTCARSARSCARRSRSATARWSPGPRARTPRHR